MKRQFTLGIILAAGLVLSVAGADTLSVFIQTEAGFVEISLDDFPLIEGTVAYEGPATSEGEANWKSSHVYRGISLRALMEAVGGVASSDTLGVVAIDGWHKMLPGAVLAGSTPAGVPILAIEMDGESGENWEDGPMLIFLPEDEAFSNADMLDALGPDFSHYFGDAPSTTGMMVKGVAYLVPNYGGETLPLQPEIVPLGQSSFPEGKLLSVVRGEEAFAYTLNEVEALESFTGQGTYTTAADVEYTATYTGVPMAALIGNVSGQATVRVTAADRYSMNYSAEMFQDTSEGTWILAYKENGETMPFDPGYFRIVQAGENNPHFSSSLSARMVSLIEVLGVYEDYSLILNGAVERLFSRSELEEGIGCPCRVATVAVTANGVTNEYTGLPLWRLLGFVDDDVHPAPGLGVYYNDDDFSDELADAGYAVALVASDGYTQSVTSDLVARDDRFIVAFKRDGVFLDPSTDGYMRFVFDDSVELPEEMRLRSVKFLTEILLDL
ncbi:MAG: hypothetical protein HQ559_07480 [Lentisphaerae bacterium]|nr:hypothetical protein [Lentisphaerota bacterium]